MHFAFVVHKKWHVIIYASRKGINYVCNAAPFVVTLLLLLWTKNGCKNLVLNNFTILLLFFFSGDKKRAPQLLAYACYSLYIILIRGKKTGLVPCPEQSACCIEKKENKVCWEFFAHPDMHLLLCMHSFCTKCSNKEQGWLRGQKYFLIKYNAHCIWQVS